MGSVFYVIDSVLFFFLFSFAHLWKEYQSCL